MKIAYVHDVIYPHVKGGAEKRVWEISRRLADRGHEVHIFGMKYWMGEDVVEREGVHLHGVCAPQDLYVDGKRSIKAAVHFSWRLLWSLRGDFDLIDAQQFPYLPCFSAKFHSKLRRVPLAITWLEVWGDYWSEYLGSRAVLGRWVERGTLHLPERIIPISESVRYDLISMGVDADKMEVVSGGVDLEKISSIRAEEKIYDIIYVGRLSEHKRVDLLLKALKMASVDRPDIRCAIIGDGPERENLRKLAKELKIEENVDFMGFLEREEEVIAGMKSSKIFVLPSTREGFGLSVLEANACGLPAVVAKAQKNAAASLVKDGINGAICDLSARSMASKIEALLKDESYKKMSDSSIEFAQAYDWGEIAKRAESVYEKL
jgi:glycosyltransferase involved in cell wall biosynthesis